MLNAIKSLVEMLSNVFNFLFTLIGSLVDLIANLPKYISILSQMFNFIPDMFKPFALLFIMGSMIMFIVGRNRGGS